MPHLRLCRPSGRRSTNIFRRRPLTVDRAYQLTVPTVGRFRTTGDAFLTTDRVVFCASKPHGSQNGELESSAKGKPIVQRVGVVRSAAAEVFF